MIQRIETIFVKNFTLQNFIAYDDDSLIDAIENTIFLSESIREHFRLLFTDDYDDLIVIKLLKCIMLKYVHMRGNWFTRSIRGEQNTKMKEVKDLSTRTRIIAAHSVAKKYSSCDDKGNNNENPFVIHVSSDISDYKESDDDLSIA